MHKPLLCHTWDATHCESQKITEETKSTERFHRKEKIMDELWQEGKQILCMFVSSSLYSKHQSPCKTSPFYLDLNYLSVFSVDSPWSSFSLVPNLISRVGQLTSIAAGKWDHCGRHMWPSQWAYETIAAGVWDHRSGPKRPSQRAYETISVGV